MRMEHAKRNGALLAMSMIVVCGCLERELKPLSPCLVSGVVQEIKVHTISEVDLLFVVDNSISMQEEQNSLRKQFPALVKTLTTGVRSDGTEFRPANDLHLGVVSTDLGLAGVLGVPSCEDATGDDGVLINEPRGDVSGCPAAFPERFLRYTTGGPKTPEETAADFGCIATLGTGGCGYEQPLEAGLKALWPSADIDPQTALPWVDPSTGMPSNRITFLSTTEDARLGHGDRANAGFVRNAEEANSIIAVVVVTDEEDCSASKADHFVPHAQLPVDSPYVGHGRDLRCYHNPQNLYDPERYIQGLKALRPGREELVIFAAIAGVPTDLVASPPTLQAKLRANSRGAAGGSLSHEQFYQTILDDPRMQQRIAPVTLATPTVEDDALVPSCREPGLGEAYPPRRLVEVARGFGDRGTVQSICQENFEPAINAIVDLISDVLKGTCLPRKLVRDASGKVACNVVWELPLPGTVLPDSPTDCGGADFLSELEEGEARRTRDGRARCKVDQLAVSGGAQNRQIERGSQGWFYDDFSDLLAEACPGRGPGQKQRVAYSELATPSNGVTIQLECLSEVQTVVVERPGVDVDGYVDGEMPTIGSPCEDGGDDACSLRLRTGGVDESMFCHRELRTCVLSCSQEQDCPPAWVCDDRQATRQDTGGVPICVNPTCG